MAHGTQVEREPASVKDCPLQALGVNVIVKATAEVGVYSLSLHEPEDLGEFKYTVASYGRNTIDIELGDWIHLSAPPSARLTSKSFNSQTAYKMHQKYRHMTSDTVNALSKKGKKATIVEYFSIPIFNISARHIDG